MAGLAVETGHNQPSLFLGKVDHGVEQYRGRDIGLAGRLNRHGNRMFDD